MAALGVLCEGMAAQVSQATWPWMHLDTQPKAWGRKTERCTCVPAQGAMAVNMGRGGRDGQGDESTLS